MLILCGPRKLHEIGRRQKKNDLFKLRSLSLGVDGEVHDGEIEVPLTRHKFKD